MSVPRHIVPRLALQSLGNRALTASLTVLAIAFSVMLLLGVEKVRTGARQSFADTISGTDLIVGARSGSIQLLLYSVFRIGNATNNVTWITSLTSAVAAGWPRTGRPTVTSKPRKAILLAPATVSTSGRTAALNAP